MSTTLCTAAQRYKGNFSVCCSSCCHMSNTLYSYIRDQSSHMHRQRLAAWLVQLRRTASMCTSPCRCTLIDPRPQKISKSQRKWLKSFSASQQPCTAAAQHHKTDQFSATNDIPPTSPDLPSQACLYAPTGLQEPAAVAPASANAALSAVTSATQLPCSAAHHNMAQAQVPAAEGDVLLHNAQAQASATEAEASSGENYAGKACTVQLTCQDEACLPQQSDSQAAAQHRPDLKGTLSQQIQVTRRWLESSCLNMGERTACTGQQCQQVVPVC